jgi:peptidoglycan/LPS O-acetylase OafA/YrhL
MLLWISRFFLINSLMQGFDQQVLNPGTGSSSGIPHLGSSAQGAAVPKKGGFREKTLPYRPDIDGMRALSIMGVLGVHCLPDWVYSGFIGVDIFFAISGFLIAGIVLNQWDKGVFSLRQFYARRINRLFPGLLVTIWLTGAAAYWILKQDDWKKLAEAVVFAGLSLSNVYNMIYRVAYDIIDARNIFGHLWSLGIEEQFYLVLPGAMGFILCRPERRRFLLPGVLLVMVMSFLLNLDFCQIGLQESAQGSFAFYTTPTRMWQLLAGVALAIWMYGRRKGAQPAGQKMPQDQNAAWQDRGRNALAGAESQIGQGGVVDLAAGGSFGGRAEGGLAGVDLLGAGILGLAFYVCQQGDPYPDVRGILPTIGTCLLIAAGPNAWVNRVFLSARPLVFLGKTSYCVYLVHMPIMALTRTAMGVRKPDFQTALWIIAASLVLGVALYFGVEERLRYAGKTAWLVAAMAITVGISFAIMQAF